MESTIERVERRGFAFPRFAVVIATLFASTLLLATTAAAQLGAVPAPTENPISEGKRVLGKILFWDEQLSNTNTVACGTCHIPSTGGTDPRSGIRRSFQCSRLIERNVWRNVLRSSYPVEIEFTALKKNTNHESQDS